MENAKPDCDYLNENKGISTTDEIKQRLLDHCSKIDMKETANDVAPLLFHLNDMKKVELFKGRLQYFCSCYTRYPILKMTYHITVFTHLIALCFLLAISLSGKSQEIEFPPQEEETVELSNDALRESLLNLLSKETSKEISAKTIADPNIDVGALDILLEPLTIDELMPEIEGWHALLVESIENLADKELELFRYNAALLKEKEENPNETNSAESNKPAPEKLALIDDIAKLRSIRTARADHLKHVLDSYESKGGDPEEVKDIRSYMAAVGGVRVDSRSVQSTALTLKQWALADDGGKRVLRHILTVIVWSIVGLLVGWLIGRITNLGLKRVSLTSDLLRRFLLRWTKRIGFLVGLLVGLAKIGTNMAPVLAALGAMGFILAFALQNTISNFASGLLILFQKPFDTGNEIEAAGVTGVVESVSLFSTHLSTAENRKVIIPNNMIWEDVVVNSTKAPTRRLSIDVEVSIEDHGLEESETILMDVMKNHPDVLNDPEASLTLSAVTSESITFTCWPWVLTKDKDRIRWELVSEFGKNLSVVRGVTKSENVK